MFKVTLAILVLIAVLTPKQLQQKNSSIAARCYYNGKQYRDS